MPSLPKNRASTGIPLALLACSVCLLATRTALAAEPNDKQPDAQDAIRATARRFVEAFNRGDAKAIVALWTPDGDYVDESGAITKGHDALEARYATLFKEHPGTKIELTGGSIRMLNADTAIEDGQTVVNSPTPELSGPSRYTAVYVRSGPAWLIASVRDVGPPPSDDPFRMDDIAWLVGDWSVEQEGTLVEIQFQRVADGAFLEGTYTVKRDGKIASSAKQITGREPSTGQVNTWIFNSDGSLAHGAWQPTEKGWVAELVGLTANGEPTTATNMLHKLDDNAFSWQSTDRTAAGMKLPNTQEVIVRRKHRQ